MEDDIGRNACLAREIAAQGTQRVEQRVVAADVSRSAATATPGLRTIRIAATDILGSTALATRNIQVTTSYLPPTLNALANLTVLEDAALQTVNLAGITSGDGAQQVITVVSASSNTSIIPNPTASYTNFNTAGCCVISYSDKCIIFTDPNLTFTSDICVCIILYVFANNFSHI